jgi:hypothetical protein
MIDQSDLDAAKQTIERSVEQFNRNLPTLYTFEGARINPPGKHETELARLSAGVESSVEKALALADRTVAQVEAARLAPHADPTGQLSPADLADANLRRAFVEEDVSTMGLEDLAERLKAVHAAGPKSSVFLHDRYAKRRWQVESAKTPQPSDLVVLGEVLRNLGIVGPKSGLSDEQQRLAEAAGSLKMFAGRQLRIAKDPEQEAFDRKKSAELVRSLF